MTDLRDIAVRDRPEVPQRAISAASDQLVDLDAWGCIVGPDPARHEDAPSRASRFGATSEDALRLVAGPVIEHAPGDPLVHPGRGDPALLFALRGHKVIR